MNDVISCERCGVGRTGSANQRPDAGEYAQHIAARWRFAHVLPGGCEDKFDFLLHGDRLERGGRDWRVRGSDPPMTMARAGEEDAAVPGVPDQGGAVSRREAGG